jgi:ribosomal protein L13E
VPGSKKNIYHIWFDYLRESQNYRTYCQWRRRCEKSHRKIPEQIRIVDFASFISGYDQFGDIFNLEFDEWWESKKKYFSKRKKLKTVFDFGKTIREVIEGAIYSFKSDEGREPSLEELKDYCVRLLDSPKRIIVAVNLRRDDSMDNIINQFKHIIRHLKKSKPDDLRNWPGAWKYPTATKRNDELRRYLDVYLLRQRNIALPEIAEKIPVYSNNKKSDLQEIHRMIRSDYKKARNILRNVERGVFPGKY